MRFQTTLEGVQCLRRSDAGWQFQFYLSVLLSLKFLKNVFWIVLQSSLKPMIVNSVSKKEWDVLMQSTQ